MSRIPAGAFLLLLLAACGRSGEQVDSAHDGRTDTVAPAPGPAGAATAHEGAGHAAPGAAGEPLLTIMQKLGSDMNTLTYALMTDDTAGVARTAAAIAEHAPIAAADLERIHGALGTDMAAFEAVDESVHVASVRLHEAAGAGRPALVVERLAEVQRGCVSCHARFRDRLRTNRPSP